MNPRLPLELDLKILTAALLALMMFPAFAGLNVGVSDTCNGDSAGAFYLEALKTAGHDAHVIPYSIDTNALKEAIKPFDLVLFTGGEDVDPARYGEEPSPKLGKVNHKRDEYDFALFAVCVAERKPILGICRGMQAMNVFFGGTLYQDIGSEYRPPAGATADRHGGMKFFEGATNPPAHELFVVPGARLGRIIGNVPMKVNSHHHQGVKKLAPGFRVAARSGDGFVEAIEGDTYPAAGVQFHPEQTLHFKPKSGFELDRHLDFFKHLDRLVSPGRQISGDYLMWADGKDVDVIAVPTASWHIWNPLERQPYSYAPFTATGTVEVCVRSGLFDLSKTEILPRSKGVNAISQSVDTVVFKLTPPMTVVLEPHGRHRALVVSANLPEGVDVGGKVKRFAPGFHRAGEIRLCDGETLYLAPGAWVEGWLRADGRNITVCGSGVLSGACWEWRKGPQDEKGVNLSGTLTRLSGENITVRDVTLFSSWGWTLVFNSVTNALVDNVKVIGGRVINDDGIDICRAKDVVIRNSFVRCQDDCVTPKWWCENLVCTNMTLWTDAANAFRTGYECELGACGLVYRNLLFKDIDVLHLSLNKSKASDYWANCAIYIQPSHGQLMENTVYEDVRFHECGPEDIFLNVKTMPINQGFDFKEAGSLNGLILRNIHLPDSRGGMCVNLSAHDAAHPIKGVRFENVTGYGPVTTSGPVELREISE